MKARRAAQSLLFSVAALALSACSDPRQEPAPKTAAPEIIEVRSAEDAKAHFLSGIDWDADPQARATLYRDVLKRNDAIGELVGDDAHYSSEFEWFALLDYEPGAYFRHPVAHAFLSYENPRITLFPRSHLPTLNAQPVWTDTATLLEDENAFYDSSWLSLGPVRDAESILADEPVDWPPRMMADKCPNERRAYALLIHNIANLNTSPETAENLELMGQALNANGYTVQTFVSDPLSGERRPYLDLSAPRGAGIRQLMSFLSIHIDFNDCCEELIVYITGETTIAKAGYSESVALDLPFAYEGPNKNRSPEKKFYPEDLATFLSQLKTCHLNVIIDTNHAEGLADDLLRLPNTESVLTSCQNHEYTRSCAVESLAGNFRDPFGRALGEQGSEFTSSVAKALFDNVAGRTQAEPIDKAATLVKSAFEAVKLYDMGYLGGQTTPVLRGRVIDSDCPCGIDEQLSRY